MPSGTCRTFAGRYLQFLNVFGSVSLAARKVQSVGSAAFLAVFDDSRFAMH